MLVYRLVKKFLVDLQFKVLLAPNGFQGRRMNLAEQSERDKSTTILPDIATSFFTRFFGRETSDGSGKETYVKAFTEDGMLYRVFLNDGVMCPGVLALICQQTT